MYPLIEDMRSATGAYLAAQPVAFRCSDEVPWFTGTPAFPDRLDPTQLTRYEMEAFASKAKNMGVNYIGSAAAAVPAMSARWRGRWVNMMSRRGGNQIPMTR